MPWLPAPESTHFRNDSLHPALCELWLPSSPMPKRMTEPPKPPEVRPRLRMWPSELVGLTFFLAIPTIAAFGGFGPTMGTGIAEDSNVRLQVEYPTRLRYHLNDTIVAHVTNTGAHSVEALTVSFDQAYLQDFSEISFTPNAQRAYEVDIGDLTPGETQIVTVEIKADEYGLSEGKVSAASKDAQLTVQLTTLTLP